MSFLGGATVPTLGCWWINRVPTTAGRRVLCVKPGSVVPDVRVGTEVSCLQTLGAVALAGGAVAVAAHTEEHWQLSGKLNAASDAGFKVSTEEEVLPDAAAGAAAALVHQDLLPQLASAILCLDICRDPGCRGGGSSLSGACLGLLLLLLQRLVHGD